MPLWWDHVFKISEPKKSYPTLSIDWSRWQEKNTIGGLAFDVEEDEFDPNDPEHLEKLTHMMHRNGELSDEE